MENYRDCGNCFWNEGKKNTARPCGQHLCYDDENGEHLPADYQPEPQSNLAMVKALRDYKRGS